MSGKYLVDQNTLHKKNLGKHTLTESFIVGRFSTIPRMGEFFHYTSPEGLKGILQSRTLFFTDCQYLNDSSERLHINAELDLFWRDNQRNYDKEFRQLIKGIRVSTFEDAEFSYMDRSSLPIICRYFVLSASHDNDSLNMWKYYAKNNTYNGYCLSLATIALSDEWIERKTGIAIEDGEVIYYSSEKQAKILEAVEKLYSYWCIYKKSDALNQKIIYEFKSWISIISLFFKDQHFAGEEEYRFVAIAPVDKLKDLFYERNNKQYGMYDFRLVNGVFTPYIKMPFDIYEKKCWAITSIGIGPSINSDQMANGLKHFLKSLPYQMNQCRIYHSEIPLRY